MNDMERVEYIDKIIKRADAMGIGAGSRATKVMDIQPARHKGRKENTMQNTANDIPVFPRIFSVISAIRAATTARADVESFSIFVPGMEVIGDYPTVEEAETALHYLPFSIRQQAAIVNQDGYCVEC